MKTYPAAIIYFLLLPLLLAGEAGAIADKQGKRENKSAAQSLVSDSFPALFPARERRQKIASKEDIKRTMTGGQGSEEAVAKDLQRERPAPVSSVISGGQGQERTKAMSAEEKRLLDQAITDFQTERYERVLEQCRAILNQPTFTEEARDKALHLAADANYSLGLKGNVQYLLAAIDQYKMILQRYPDPGRENDLLYYRMAISYEKLKFYHESINALERLILSYPDSVYLPDAMFKIGDLLYKTVKYNRAIERLFAYMKKYPQGKYAKLATVTMGDCYSRLQKWTVAIQWYDEALNKWPDLTDLPPHLLMNMGTQYFEAGKFELSLQLYSLFVNVLPHNEFSKKAFYLMARSSERMGETAMALHIYRLFIERYPDSKEAEECSLSMANLGVSNPGVKFPLYVLEKLAIDDYLEPMQSYDKLMAKHPEEEQAAAVLLGKGNALVKYGRIQEGVDVYLELLGRFPQSRSSVEGRGKINLTARSLVSDSWAKGDYLAVAAIYFGGAEKGLPLAEDFDMASKIGESLRITGFYDDSTRVYATLRKTNKDKEDMITLAEANIDLAKGRHREAEDKLKMLLKKVTTRDLSVFKEVKTTLADLYLKTGLFAEANLLYEDVLTVGGESPGRVYRNYGRSLQAVNMNSKAITHYLSALKDYQRHPQKYTADLIADIYAGLGDAYYGEHGYQEGIAAYQQALTYVADGNYRGWLLCRIGNGYASLGEFSEAEKSFTQLKEKSEGEFWPKIAAYFIEKSSDRGKNAIRIE